MTTIEEILNDKAFQESKTKEQLKELEKYMKNGIEMPITYKNGKYNIPS